MTTKTALLAPPAPHRLRVWGGQGPPPAYRPSPTQHSQASNHDRTSSLEDDDAIYIDADPSADDSLPDYTSSPAPPPYSKLPPLALGLFAGWKATAARSLLVRAAGPADFAVTFPSGRACLLAQRSGAQRAFSLRAPTISTPKLTLAPLAERASCFAATSEDSSAVVRISWAREGAEVWFQDVLGGGGDVRLDARETRAGSGFFGVRYGSREVAQLRMPAEGCVHCNVEEGMDGLIVVLLGITLLMGSGGLEGLKGRVRHGLLRGASGTAR